MTFSDQYFNHLVRKYPSLREDPTPSLRERLGDNLISPLILPLSSRAIEQAQQIVKLLFKIRRLSAYQALLTNALSIKGIKDPGNHSILMSYDFHWNGTELKLIEVNTNAAFLIMGYEMYQLHQLHLPLAGFRLEQLANNIQNELRLQKKDVLKPRVAIIDQQPQNQKLFLEFLLYKCFFESLGWTTEILDVTAINENTSFGFIYNRSTDFYFDEPESQYLKKAFLSRSTCISPNPYEYLLLADKGRMLDWSNSDFLQNLDLSEAELHTLHRAIPKTLSLSSETKEELWKNRKTLFFKPLNSYGSKSTYDGHKISRPKFEELVNTKKTIAQELVPPGKHIFDNQEFKFDLRFFAYEDQVQMVMARLYQGQLTNFKAENGGWACVRVET